MITPYWSDETCSLYLGDMREVLPALGVKADLVLADPPYGETSLAWDRWPDGWVEAAAAVSNSLWCFGSLRMYLEHRDEFRAARWKLSQDIVWEKHTGGNAFADRFQRVHEQPTHWYQGAWRDIYHSTPTTQDAVKRTIRHKHKPPHWGDIADQAYTSEDGGPRLMRSVIYMRSMHHRAIHPTQKPGGLLEPMVTYGCPPRGLVIDPFAGSGATLVIARMTGRPSIGIELREECAEQAALWLAQADLFGGAA